MNNKSLPDWLTPGWIVHEVAPDLRVREIRAMPALAGAVDREIDRLWSRALTRTGGGLFNGRVFSADAIASDLVVGHWTEYRRIVAQMERPDLFDELCVRPMAVGGAILGPDGVVLGCRPERAVYQAGLWQLPPAGSLDMSTADPDGEVAWQRQVLTELREEMGMAPHTVRIIRPLCIVEHAGSHVCDLGVAIDTDLNASAIAAAHAQAQDAEYDRLRIVALPALPAFLAEAGAMVTPQALVFLTRMGLLTLPHLAPRNQSAHQSRPD